jgi:hypothetical protein
VQGSAVGRAGPNGREGKAVDGAVGVSDDRDNFDASNTSFVWSCRDVDPVGGVSGVLHGYFNVPIREVLNDA